jgi:hypothetical protein
MGGSPSNRSIDRPVELVVYQGWDDTSSFPQSDH